MRHSDVRFNVTHSGGIALLAFTRGREIGVDVEQVRHDFDPGAIARRYFSAHEQNQLADLPAEEKVDAFFRCWTRKEAYIKATGDGLSLPLSQFDVSLVPGETNALLATRPDESEAASWLLREVPAGPGYVAAALRARPGLEAERLVRIRATEAIAWIRRRTLAPSILFAWNGICAGHCRNSFHTPGLGEIWRLWQPPKSYSFHLFTAIDWSPEGRRIAALFSYS